MKDEIKAILFIDSLEKYEVDELTLRELLELEIWIEDTIKQHEQKKIERKTNVQFNTY